MALMRLLHRKADGEIVFRETTSYDIPAYAILSHTWGKDEVSLQEVEAGAGKNKAGWEKIRFCAKQAAADGLQYFWVDTCCIDKKNAVELGAAINSMFRWYQNASRCYVYLSDVSKSDSGADDQTAWEDAFRKSRWFTRGWTLQELIAPRLVDFFSLEGERLGSKLSLESEIHEITSIERNALRGDALSNFSIKERKFWAEKRVTTVDEDAAYCLIGIFDVSIVLNYGERKDQALKRLEEEIQKLNKGNNFEQFAVGLNLLSFSGAAQFVAREKELSKMHELLHGHNNRTCVVLHGLGGIGKTQLTIEYIKRHKEKYTAILWLNVNDQDSLKLGFRDIALQVLKYHPSTSLLAGVNLDDLDQIVYAVKAWLDLQENIYWLMIYDNYDNPKVSGNLDRSAVDIRQFLPQSDQGSIIITTRSSQVHQGYRIYIQKLLDAKESLEILSNTSRRKDIAEDPGAVKLVKELDGLPIALSTAGAYLEHVSMTLSDYLRLYKASWLKLQTMSPQLESYQDRSLYTTWQVTFDRIQQQSPASSRLLKLWAYFDRQDIWFELLRHANSSDDQWIQELTEDELSFNKAVALLCSFGLVDPDKALHQQQFGSGGYSVHSCVHSWMEFVLNKEWDQRLAQLALNCVALEIPMRNEKNSWILQRRLLHHANKQEQFILNGKVDFKGIEWTLNMLGLLWSDQGKLAEAEVMYTRALQGFEEALGPKHTSIFATVHNLGILYKIQGKLAEAEVMYTWALQGHEEALGPKHISTLNIVHNLGNLYTDQGKLAEAEVMYTRALQGFEEALGPKHTSTLDTVHNLGNLYRDQDKLAEAEAMYTRALQGFKEALGPKHTSILCTINNLGLLYADQGKLAEAERMYTRALEGYEEALGPKHTSTLDTVHNLGKLYKNQGKLAEAERMYTRSLQGYEEALGPKHTSTLRTINNLGNLYKDQNKLVEAEAMYTRALQGFEKALGPKHTSTLCTINNLGLLYADQGKLAEAEVMYTRALQGFEEALGPKHTSTLDTVHNLGNLYKDQNKLAEAEAMYTRALQGFEEALGPKHTSTLRTINNLGLLYADQGKLAEAERMYTRALEGYEDALSPQLVPSHLPALNAMFAFGDLFSQTGRKDMAKEMYTRALSGYTTVQGPSSKWCEQLKDRLQALQIASAELEMGQDKLTKPGIAMSRAF